MTNEVNTIENQNLNVEEIAYLLISDQEIGVSNELNDIMTYLKTLPEEKLVYILKAPKDKSLSIEQKILIADHIANNLCENILTVPERLDDYNLIKREQQKNKLFTRLLK